MSDRDSSDEVDNRPVKKFKTGNIVQRYEKATKVGMTSSAMPEDVNMGEPESEEEYYHEDEVYESDEEYGDSFCIFCDDGGVLLCCDGPCMRSFHATKEAGGESKCRSLGLSEAAVAVCWRSVLLEILYLLSIKYKRFSLEVALHLQIIVFHTHSNVILWSFLSFWLCREWWASGFVKTASIKSTNATFVGNLVTLLRMRRLE